MNKKIFAMLLCLLLLGAVACSDDDAGNDAALRGIWNGFMMMDPGVGYRYTEIQVNDTTLETYTYNNNTYNAYMTLTFLANQGTYASKKNELVATITHMYVTNYHIWAPVAMDPNYQTYTIAGSGVGAVLAIMQTNGLPTTYLTNMTPYAAIPSKAGTWVAVITNNVEGLGTIIMYQTNIIGADGSLSGTTHVAMTNVPSAWSNFISQQNVGVVTFNSETNIMLSIITEETVVTNVSAMASSPPLFSTMQIYKRERIPTVFLSETMMLISLESGPMVLNKE